MAKYSSDTVEHLAQVCKYKCGLCDEEVDTDRMKAHITAQHQGDQVQTNLTYPL